MTSSEMKTQIRHVNVWGENLALDIVDCLSHDSDDHINLDPVSCNWGRKEPLRTTCTLAAYKGPLSNNVLKKAG